MRAGHAAGVVIVAVGGFLTVGALVHPSSVGETEYPGVEQPVMRSTVVCPLVDGEPDHAATVGVLALPDVETAADEGEQSQPITVTALELPPDPEAEAPDDEETDDEETDDEETEDEASEDEAPDDEETEAEAPETPEPVATVSERGVPTVTDVNTGNGTSFAVHGRGSLASGIAAEQSGLLQRSDLRGLATSPCTAPDREHWFVGGSGQVGHRGRLVLSNPTDVPAVVDLELWDESGPIDAPATKDIGVPARSQEVILLDALAPESVSVGVHINASQGRVAAALEVRESDGDDGQGMSFIPAAHEPAERIAIPGVPSHGEGILRVLAPGDVDAIMSLQVLGADGPFTPAGLEVNTVPAGSTLDIPLDALGDGAGGLLLESDQPITAAVRVVDNPEEGAPEVAVTSATPALTNEAAALLSRTSDGLESTLSLTSTVETATRATVRTLGPDGATADEAQLDIPPLSTVSLPLEAPEGSDVASVVVQPEAPDSIVVSREMAGSDDDGALLDLMTVASPPVTVRVPDVVGELPDVPAPDQLELDE